MWKTEAEIAAELSKPQAALILALSGDEFRDWLSVEMPGTYATRRKLRHFVEVQSPRYPWMVKLNETGLEVRRHLLEGADNAEG